jgi:4-alpha-glucanotransferase
MPKNPKVEFGHPSDAPYMSVVTPSSHDMSTIRGWWEENRSKTQKFYNTILGHDGGAPFFCEPWVVKEIVNQHLYSPAMWAIFPLQDLVGMDGNLRRNDVNAERINVPANPKHYWRYRFHLTVEELLEKKEFNEMLAKMILESGRNSAY